MHTKREHPEWSWTTIGKHVGASHQTAKHWSDVFDKTGDVKDLPRSGRRQLISQHDVEKVKHIATQKGNKDVFSAARLARVLKAECNVRVSARTVRRVLGAVGWQYATARRVLMLKPSHKQRRLLWAKGHLNKRTAFASWMITDSKLFQLHRTGGKMGVKMWHPKDFRPNCPAPQKSKSVHAYLGVTKFGVTDVIFVTGGGTQKSEFINPKTCKPYSGLSAIEYQKHVIPKLIQGGNAIFAASGRWASEWIFQQDNARPHAAKGTKVLLQELMPNRVEQEWPASSPDISWIENIWSWADRQLQTQYGSIESIADLKAALQKIFKSTPRIMLQNYVKGMPKRLHKVIEESGGQIR